MSISYAYMQTSILSTPVYMVASEQGLMYLSSTVHDERELFTQLKKQFNIEQHQCTKSGQPFIDVLEELKRFEQGRAIRHDQLRLDLRGTPFQQNVWQCLQHIPYGQTISYGEVACQIGNTKAVRAVGRAIGANPVLLIVPCHRVIGKNGTLTGFSAGLELKKKWLEYEGAMPLG